MSRDELRAVKDAVTRALAEERRVPDAEEGARAFLPFVMYLDQDEKDSRSAWRLVSAIRDRKPEVYNRFVGERRSRPNIRGKSEAGVASALT